MGEEIESKFDATPEKRGGRKHGQMGEKKAAEMDTAEARSRLFNGVTLSEAEVIFRMDARTIQGRIAGQVKPVGNRRGTQIFLIREIAPYIVKPVGDMGEFIKRANPRDLPPLLQKEYWNGQRARQTFLEQEGQLWRTDRVSATLADAFKEVRNFLLLIPDQLALKTTLSDRQREEIAEMLDQTMTSIREKLVDVFGGEPEQADRPGSFDEAADLSRDDTFDDPAAEAGEVDYGEGEQEDEGYDDTFD